MVGIFPLREEGLGNTAWLVDIGDGDALVIDPSRDPRPPLAVAKQHGLRIRVVTETHLHADFVSGSRELVAAGAQLLAPAGAGLAFAHTAVGDGAEIDLGGLALRALATPGHTPEHLAYLLVDGERPLALFSGGVLLVGGVARPDLIAPEQTTPLARAAWRSITRLLDLPDDLPVYPTHGGGSFCSSGGGSAITTTIGAERAANPLLQVPDEDAFVAALLGGLGSFPPYFLRLRDVNRAGPRVYGTSTPALTPLDSDRVAALVEHEGAIVVDVRPVADFAAGHVPGALAIELRPQFATWLGWLVANPATLLVFVRNDDQDRDDLVRQCLTVGYESLAELAGGVAAWTASGRLLSTTALLDRPPPSRAVVDVRQASEWAEDHLADATHVELGSLPTQLERVPEGPLVTHCEHGQRSMTAASLLERAGRGDVAVFTGGPADWRAQQPTGRG